jgi:hypothetical protein
LVKILLAVGGTVVVLAVLGRGVVGALRNLVVHLWPH